MQNQKLQSELDAINYVRSNCAVAEANPECQAHWARYLCVMVAGFLENALYEVYRDYLDSANLTSMKLKQTRNPQSGAFINMAKKFNHSWLNELQEFMSDAGRAIAIDTIMRQRHRIAHGEASEITMSQIAEYLPKCVAVVEFVEDKLHRQRQGL